MQFLYISLDDVLENYAVMEINNAEITNGITSLCSIFLMAQIHMYIFIKQKKLVGM